MNFTAEQSYFSFFNPLLERVYNNYLHYEKSTSKNLEEVITLFSSYEKEISEKLLTLDKKEFITIDDYFNASTNINLKKNDRARLNKLLIVNQNEIILTLLNSTNWALKKMSDEQFIDEISNEVKDTTTKAYYPTVIRIQKILLGNLRDDLEKAYKSNWRAFSKIPIINIFGFLIRLMPISTLNRSMAASSILIIRLTRIFDKNKIKKEITQAYEEFATAGLLESKYKYDNYSKFIGSIIEN